MKQNYAKGNQHEVLGRANKHSHKAIVRGDEAEEKAEEKRRGGAGKEKVDRRCS